MKKHLKTCEELINLPDDDAIKDDSMYAALKVLIGHINTNHIEDSSSPTGRTR